MRKIDTKDPFSLQFTSNFSSSLKRHNHSDIKRITSGATLPYTPLHSRKSFESKENFCVTHCKGKFSTELGSVSPTPKSIKNFKSIQNEITEVPEKRMPLMTKTIGKRSLNNEKSLVNVELKSTVDGGFVYFRVEDSRFLNGIDFSRKISRVPFDNDCPTEEWQIDVTVELFKKEILQCLEDIKGAS